MDHDTDRRDFPGCAALSREVGDEPLGTAPLIRSFVLVEHPAPWGADAHKRVPAEVMTPRTAGQYTRLSDAGEIRALLIRRPGRRPAPTGRTVLVGSTRDGSAWVERIEYADPAATPVDVDLDAVAAGVGGHGSVVTEPVLLACTHGTRDMCCASAGRPVATALAAAHPGWVWESTHQGGHRFAANLLVLPHGIAYGRLDPPTALRAAAAARAGRMLLDGPPGGAGSNLRGSTRVGGFEQVAELAVRRHTGIDSVSGVGAVELTVDPTDGPDRVRVEVRAGGRTFTVAVHRHRTDPASPSRCGNVQPQQYLVEELRELSADVPV